MKHNSVQIRISSIDLDIIRNEVKGDFIKLNPSVANPKDHELVNYLIRHHQKFLYDKAKSRAENGA